MPTAAAAVHKVPQYTREKKSLLCTAAPFVCVCVCVCVFVCLCISIDTNYFSISRSTRETLFIPRLLRLVYWGATVHETLLHSSLPWWVEFSLPQCRNWIPFVQSHKHFSPSVKLKKFPKACSDASVKNIFFLIYVHFNLAYLKITFLRWNSHFKHFIFCRTEV